jgi:hypothetical protein
MRQSAPKDTNMHASTSLGDDFTAKSGGLSSPQTCCKAMAGDALLRAGHSIVDFLLWIYFHYFCSFFIQPLSLL